MSETPGQAAREAFGELGADWYPGTPWHRLHEDLRAQWEAAAQAGHAAIAAPSAAFQRWFHELMGDSLGDGTYTAADLAEACARGQEDPLTVQPSDDVKPAPELAEPVRVAGKPYSDYPSLVAAMQDEIDRERTERLHLAGDRDEARSDYSRLRAAILEGGQSDAAVRKRCLAIIATAGTAPVGTPLDEQRAHRPDLGTAWRLLDEARAERATLRNGISELIADLDAGCATRPPGQSHTEHETAIALRKLLEGK